eukprot:8509696-Pyramimonas_sp.AAC.1
MRHEGEKEENARRGRRGARSDREGRRAPRKNMQLRQDSRATSLRRKTLEVPALVARGCARCRG